jgi:hypothetical protein
MILLYLLWCKMNKIILNESSIYNNWYGSAPGTRVTKLIIIVGATVTITTVPYVTEVYCL